MASFWVDKRVFYELASIQHPIVGNQPTWFWFEDAQRIRQKSGLWLVRASDASCHIAPDSGPLVWRDAIRRAWDIELSGHKATIWKAIDPSMLVMQGNIFWDDYRLAFEWSSRKMLRDSLMMPKPSRGLSAKIILESYIDPEPLQYILDLMDAFPGCVMEVGILSRRAGWRNWNLVVWEIREY